MSENPFDENPVLRAIASRRSLRRYRDVPVSDEILRTILTAGVWSPSAHNRQPFRFAVIRTREMKEKLAVNMGARLRQDLTRDDVPESVIKADVSRSYQRLTNAPVLIVVCLSMQEMDVYRDAERNHNEYLLGVQSVAMAGQNILLSAHALGLGACWMCAPLFCPDVVKETLNLADDWQPQGVISMGYPAESKEKTRKPLETGVLWL